MILSLICCAIQATIVMAVGAALYLLASRRLPAQRATLALTTLLAVAVVSTLSLCPLPSWWSLLPAHSADEKLETPREALAVNATAASSSASSERNDNDEPHSAGSRQLIPLAWLPVLPQSTGAASQTVREHSRRWLPGFVALFAVGFACFVVRIGFGLAAVRRILRTSRPIDDAIPTVLLADLQESSGSRREIFLRECECLAAAATIGWRRPVILLPAAWREWSAGELRAVLAHEAAHIERRDYPARLAAYSIAALHFYHPLAHWLARRLVEQQEFAADATAQSFCGGRRQYLAALSQVALRQGTRPRAWPTSIALPVSSTFLMRRIEMLRAKDGSLTSSQKHAARWAGVALLTVVAIVASALRTTAQQPAAPAQPRVADKRGEAGSPKNQKGLATSNEQVESDRALFRRPPLDLSLLAGKGSGVYVLRLAELLRPGMMHPIRDAYRQELFESLEGVSKGTYPALKFEQIELVAGNMNVVVENSDEPGQSKIMFGSGRTFIRTIEPFDWKAFVVGHLPETVEKQHRGRTYLELPVLPMLGPTKVCVYVLDDRTLAFATSEADLQGMISASLETQPRSRWHDHWSAVDGGLLTLAVDNQEVKWLEVRGSKGEWPGADVPLLSQAQFIAVGADWNPQTGRIVLRSRAITEQPDQAPNVKRAVQELSTFGLAALELDDVQREVGDFLLPHLKRFLLSATLQVSATAAGRGQVDGRAEVTLPIEQLREMISAAADDGQ